MGFTTGCVVAIVINRAGQLPFAFAFNGFLDTIGIVVAILINNYLKNPFKRSNYSQKVDKLACLETETAMNGIDIDLHSLKIKLMTIDEH